MKKIAIFTNTRAEFGLLSPLINEIKNSKELECLLFAGGTHLCPEHGYTINEIENAGFEITEKIDFLLNDDDPYSLSYSLSVLNSKLAEIFRKYKFDAVCILGDRYELLPIVQTALLFNKIIIHLNGGEISEGAIDNQIRYMVSKAAHLHFTSCREYSQNLIKSGENKSIVFKTGGLSADNLTNLKIKTKEFLFNELNLDLELPTAILTYHPVTLENKISNSDQIKNVFNALESFNIQLVVTAPNADSGRTEILNIINEQIDINENYHYFESLGITNYINLARYSDFVIGNSSSGIVEIPFLKKPTVNIGSRQKGRIRHKSIIDTGYDKVSIENAVKKALSEQFKKEISQMKYKFGEGNSAQKIVSILENIKFDNDLLKKTFNFKQNADNNSRSRS